MKEGDIILAPVPQADGGLKTRPALVLREMPPFRDVLICGISTQVMRAGREPGSGPISRVRYV
jgi:mRNA interferase MazF